MSHTAKSPRPDAVDAIERLQVAIARLRGWSRHGAHERAAQALDAALCALSEAEAALHAAPYAAAALAALHTELDRLTGA